MSRGKGPSKCLGAEGRGGEGGGGGKGRGNTARVFENETYARGLGELVFAGRRNPDRGNEIFYAPPPLSSTLARVTSHAALRPSNWI